MVLFDIHRVKINILFLNNFELAVRNSLTYFIVDND